MIFFIVLSVIAAMQFIMVKQNVYFYVGADEHVKI